MAAVTGLRYLALMLSRLLHSRIVAGLAATILFGAAVATVCSTVLRHHACEYDGLRDWSELALVLTGLGGALAAVWCGVQPRPRLLAIAIALPVLVLSILAAASWRHARIELACASRSLDQAAARCGLTRGQFTVAGSSNDTVVTVRSTGPARQCLADWAAWQSQVSIDGITET